MTNNLKQMQQQVQCSKNQLIQQEQQYYIYQDLENILNCLVDAVTAIELFENLEDQGYLPIALNKLILQINISNGIHYDIFNQHQSNKPDLSNLNKEKQKAKIIFENLLKENFDIKNEQIQKICDLYTSINLTDNPMIKQMNPLKTNVKSEFNQKTLQKILNGIAAADNQLQNVQKGQYKPPSMEDYKIQIQKRKQLCKSKLMENFQIQKIANENGPKRQQILVKFKGLRGESDSEPSDIE